MLYIHQFETFDPIGSDVPDYPIALSKIAIRARSLLGWRIKDQMVLAAKRISSEIEDYFEREKERKIYQLQCDVDPSDDEYETYFEWDGGTAANGRWIFKESMADELGIPTEENTNDVDAFKSVIVDRDCDFFLPEGAPEPEPKEYSEGKDYELFAVLSLCLLSDAIEWSRREDRHSLPIASRIALQAMDAVCYAEHLREAEWLVTYAKKKSAEELTGVLEKEKFEHQELLRKQRSEIGKAGAIKRHAAIGGLKEFAIQEYRKGTWASANAAAHDLSEQVINHGRAIGATLSKANAQRTIAEWIRKSEKSV